MMEFQEFLKEKERMCGKVIAKDCGIAQANGDYCMGCSAWVFTNPAEAEEIVKKWCDEHPVVNNKDKFKEVFGRPYYAKDGSCSCGYERVPCVDCGWWNEEYKAPESVEK